MLAQKRMERNTETLKCILNTLKNYFDAINFESKFTPKTSEFTVLGIGILLFVTFYVKLLILG